MKKCLFAITSVALLLLLGCGRDVGTETMDMPQIQPIDTVPTEMPTVAPPSDNMDTNAIQKSNERQSDSVAPAHKELSDTNAIPESNGQQSDTAASTDQENVLYAAVVLDTSTMHNAAITADGDLYTWGQNSYGQLGYASTEFDQWGSPMSTIPKRVPLISEVVAAYIGLGQTMVITKNGDLLILGRGMSGFTDREDEEIDSTYLTPIKVPELQSVAAVSLESWYGAAVTVGGDVYTWGANLSGVLGYTSDEMILISDELVSYSGKATKVPGIGGVVAISLGMRHIMALTASGEVYTWGSNDCGDLGHSATTCDQQGYPYTDTPTRVPELTDVVAISAGSGATAAITAEGELFTWGYNEFGNLGYPSTDYNAFEIPISRTPTKVPGLTGVTMVAMQHEFSVAVTVGGEVYTWGNNYNGQLGLGDTLPRSTPTKVPGLEEVVAISVMSSRCAAITAGGDLYTWGNNFYGQLGYASSNVANDRWPASFSPKKVPSLENVVAVSFSNTHAAAVTADGDIYTWGQNSYGQLGDGTTVYRYTPKRITPDM